MTTPRLYWRPGTASMAPHAALGEIGLDYELVLIERDEAQSDAGYRALNPLGVVPTLVDGDLVLSESAAILLYLADRYPEARLVPAERADYYRWPICMTNTLQTTMLRFFYPERYGGGEVGNVAEAEAQRHFDLIESHLEGRRRGSTASTCTRLGSASRRSRPPAATSTPGSTGPGSHAGDLSPLWVDPDGRGWLELQTNRFAVADLLDTDGSAIIVHVGRDNLAHIPSRYSAGGPDAATLSGPFVALHNCYEDTRSRSGVCGMNTPPLRSRPGCEGARSAEF